MHLVNGEHDSELLQAQAHVWNHIFSFINSMSLKCAIQLGIPDAIHYHGKPMTLNQLITALPVHPSKTLFVYRLMRILTHSGFFTLQKAHGKKFWEYAEKEPKVNHLFNEAMASDARLVTGVVIDKCKHVFKGLKSLIDVGGGTGTVAKAIAKAFPNLECTVYDLPHVVADMQSHDNLKYAGGNMFEAVPSADAVLLKWILHDWSDEECVKILKKCKEAITSNGKMGKVIIIDMLVEKKEGNDESTETQLYFDMLMMVLVTGKERDEKEWAKLFLEAGFTRYKINPILGLRSLIEVYP
ncbi:hypothetical protein Patl1_02355 [Pistacia atlantica]|uniref:Uncharacterized protein n=1 Tax=Pistacia atlantica TaxID=434234 RepID=A0ACC1C525_9ROSI|nr:hypothetical protein Patl1_02355 [Pistacia atlantica]